MIQIYHNPRCSKSRECLAFMGNSKEKFEVIKYLEDRFTFDELQNIINKLGIPPIDLIRKTEKIWIENFKNKTLTDQEIIEAMVSNPTLIERPIVVNGNKAIIARPTEKAAEVF